MADFFRRRPGVLPGEYRPPSVCDLLFEGMLMASGADPNSAPYWRIIADEAVTDTIAFCATEIEMFVSGGVADECVGGAAISGGDAGSWSASRAFDDDTGTFWGSSQSGAGVKGVAYIGYHFATPKSINRIRFRSSPSGSAATPVIMLVQRSYDGVSWTTVLPWYIGAVAANTWYETPETGWSVAGYVFPASGTLFDYTGADQSYTVPAGVTHVRTKERAAGGGTGGAGGGAVGGGAATVYAVIPVTPGEVLTVRVGGRGRWVNAGVATAPVFGGGGPCGTAGGNIGGSGGGLAGIFRGGTPLAVAGAGGGGDHYIGHGGPGGLTGSNGTLTSGGFGGATAATGGTPTSGGTGGTSPDGSTFNGTNGSSLKGGTGGSGSGPDPRGGGGGGGGLYGGGGGPGVANRSATSPGGGAGGSSGVHSSCTASLIFGGSGRNPGLASDGNLSGYGVGASANADDATAARIIIY
ncbi:discoidin domain-containing protein [Azospirillum sp.]|uniref:discoidin domain-containing protein n=1 Tax=Azospirillum sp. TaxID=34012 RepID=UPI003D73C7A5